jgi:hypothetical protein
MTLLVDEGPNGSESSLETPSIQRLFHPWMVLSICDQASNLAQFGFKERQCLQSRTEVSAGHIMSVRIAAASIPRESTLPETSPTPRLSWKSKREKGEEYCPGNVI